MSINGVEIFAQKIIYTPTWYGIATWVFTIALFFIFITWFIDTIELWAGIGSAILLACFITALALTFNETNTIFNQPKKIEYTIEILDDEAWKEIGPNYTVKTKVYENKEIYIIEGDYDNVNNY